MLSRRPLSTAGTALIGIIALLITQVAHAVINLDDNEGDVAFAKETLTTEVEDSAGYYVVMGATAGMGVGNLNVVAKIGVGGTRDLFVDFTLSGLVFNGTPTLSSVPNAASCGSGDGLTGGITLRGGGAKGDNHVSFIVGGAARIDANTPDSLVCLVVGDIGVSPSMSGSISLNTEDDVASRPLMHSESFMGAVKVIKGLMPSGDNNNPVASVASGFMEFKDTGRLATVGTINIVAVMGVLNAVNGMPAMLGDLIEVNRDDDAAAVDNTKSSIVFTGDFSFADKVMLLDDAAACTAEDTDKGTTESMTRSMTREDAADLLMTGDDADKNTLKTLALGFALDKHLCLMVYTEASGKAIPIPPTAPYVATKTFVASTPGAAFPPGKVEHELGYITRDGTTIRLPYLTQFSAYNQRIVIVNRGGKAPYTFTFMAEDDVMVTRGPKADGMLPANSITYLSLLYGDLVTIEGSPNRAAATLIIEARKEMIDVLISQTNADGGTDTVTYTETDR